MCGWTPTLGLHPQNGGRFCHYNQFKYTWISCGTLHRNKSMRYATGERELKLYERARRDVILNLHHPPACLHLPFLNI